MRGIAYTFSFYHNMMDKSMNFFKIFGFLDLITEK